MDRKTRDCTCESCVAACRVTPGWFAPGEAEKAAELLNLPFEEFKTKFLKTDYWEASWDFPRVYVLAPRKVGIEDDTEIATWDYAYSRGTCVFLVNERCAIHKAKPYECRVAMCCEAPRFQIEKSAREKIMEMWRDKQMGAAREY